MSDDSTSSNGFGRTARMGGLVAGQGARVAGGRALDRVRSDDAKARAQRKRTAAVVEQIVVQLGSMKGAAMKFGQVLSTVDLPGLEPPDSERIKERLAALRDDAPSVSFDKLEKLMASEWGEPVSRVMAEIDPESIAAASIGQVHRATTRDGRDVAVKVQYPGIAEAVETDLRNLGVLMPLLGRLAPGLDTKAVATELRERVSEELDYELEAQSQRQMGRGWRDHPHCFVPAVLTDLSTRRVLVTEYVDGRGFGAVKQFDEAERDRVAEIMFRFYHDTARRLEIACGDPHPGNFLYAPDGRLAFLDFGMLRRLPAAYMDGEADVYRGLRAEDPAAVRAALDALGYLPHPWEFPDDLLYAHMRAASSWIFSPDQPLRLTGSMAYEMMEEVMALGQEWRSMVRSFSVPREGLLLRRMDNIVYSAAADLRAACYWRALSDETTAGEPARTALGKEHAAWLAGRQ